MEWWADVISLFGILGIAGWDRKADEYGELQQSPRRSESQPNTLHNAMIYSVCIITYWLYSIHILSSSIRGSLHVLLSGPRLWVLEGKGYAV